MKNLIPNLANEGELLETLGIKSVEDLFSDVPKKFRKDLNIEPPKSEIEVTKELKALSEKNKKPDLSFLGGGLAEHYVPYTVDYLTSRSEFITAYTPYQPEVSQGALQSIFEYQSYMAELYDMDVVNASLYDFATALGEACLMCCRIKEGKKFLIPRAISEAKKAVLKNYAKSYAEIEEVNYDERGMMDINDLKERVNKDTMGVYVESPNGFGVIEENVKDIRDIAPLLIYGADPLSLAVIKPPGEYGADIAIGGMHFSPSFGGPSLGVLACRQELVRKMPGRVIGLTRDRENNRAFCMTLQTREQHIRREKATSNICTNEGLLTIASAIYFSLLGKNGIRKIANANIKNAMDLAKRVNEIFDVPFMGSTFFSEFLFKTGGIQKLRNKVFKKGIEFGPLLSDDSAMICTTEIHDKKDRDKLINALREEKENV